MAGGETTYPHGQPGGQGQRGLDLVLEGEGLRDMVSLLVRSHTLGTIEGEGPCLGEWSEARLGLGDGDPVSS